MSTIMTTDSTLPAYTTTTTISSSPSYLLDAKRSSISSRSPSPSIASSAPTYTEHATFTPTQTYQINTAGKHINDFHCFPRETDISITSASTQIEHFRAVRTNNNRGNSDLFFNNNDAKTGGMQLAAQSTYRFLPGRHATVKFFSLSLVGQENLIEEIEIRSKCMSFSNSVVFTSARFGSFIWRYSSRKERKSFTDKVDSLLVLEKYVGDREKETVQVARLIRGDATRTEGSSRWNSEGNGGLLEVNLSALGGGEKSEVEMAALVLSTCLVMLKREIDNLSVTQAVIVS